jgi:drug/metabolite transporter (DMT)-like permease
VLVLLGQQLTALLVVGAIVAATSEHPPSREAILLSLAAGTSGAIALGCFYRALAVGTMSIVAPISASGVTVPVIVGVATGDRPSGIQAVGLAITFAGVLLASRERGEGKASSLSIALALVAALGFGTYFTLSDSAADESILWLLLLGRCAAVPLLVGAALVNRTLRVPQPPRHVAVRDRDDRGPAVDRRRRRCALPDHDRAAGPRDPPRAPAARAGRRRHPRVRRRGCSRRWLTPVH